ncbi:MAG TPA: hypothetical protein DCP92_10305 [Nitrospiraceae bacterium]|jgi:hypothetical protein|nr:hypothetical protein [Nitrospiraceae bacterium]
MTSQKHVGDFQNDPLLPGSTATQKADAFCNADPAKPTSSIYKALMVDGINRDAVKGIDWVLQPNTTYYRADGITVIGTTTVTAIFPALYADLSNGVIAQQVSDMDGTTWVWTGIGSGADFSAGSDCAGWSSASGVGDFGLADSTTQTAFIDMLTNCDARLSLYCVEQP